jgi:hypothetical protein
MLINASKEEKIVLIGYAAFAIIYAVLFSVKYNKLKVK